MHDRARFAYAQARVQARHGRRPSEAVWGSLDACSTFGHYLQTAEATSLEPWVRNLDPKADVHAVERSLRIEWRRYVSLIAEWPPESWANAVRWVDVLVDLPALSHLLHGLPAQGWMQDDPVLGPVAVDDLKGRFEAARKSRFAPLVQGGHEGERLQDTWFRHWSGLWPGGATKHQDTLGTFTAILEKHLTEEPEETEGTVGLADRLTHMFRHYGQGPVAVFSHVALIALDLQRLRAGLVQRLLFPGVDMVVRAS